MSVKTILNAEDNATNRKIVRDLLEWHGYRVVEALDGVEAVELAQREVPDLILMDIQLPRMSGYDAASAIHGDARLARVPIIAVTSFGMIGDEKRAYEAGCDDYISKPFRPRLLIQKIVRLLDGTGSCGDAEEERP
ncbi:MAG: response regulator [Spirochaetaceae bacterium]|nr:MAG: response regulator [Spirochaetaceae bacterium]